MACITAVTPTICALIGVEPPRLSTGQTIEAILAGARQKGIGRGARCLIYAPDALGSRFMARHPGLSARVTHCAPLRIPLTSVMPSVTPVCFASMMTGAMPASHGIMKYEKPVLACDTLFDALARAGRKVAMVAVKGSSMDLVFRGRPIDYFSEPYDQEVAARSIELIAQGCHEVIIAYNQEYDDVMHRTTPESPEALEAAARHVSTFEALCGALSLHWKNHDYALLFAPDHGAHTDPSTGRGTHGDNFPDDMEIQHFWGLYKNIGKQGKIGDR